jgi:hypothetical protein
MAKRKRGITPKKIEEKIKKGHGQGHKREYKTWLRINDVPSKGLSTRGKGWKTQRVHHFLSNLEYALFFVLEWSTHVVDIREQFPLDQQSTIDIANRLEIKHPTDPTTKELTVMTTDFYIDIEEGNLPRQVAIAVKPESKLNGVREIEKLQIERQYWLDRDVEWHIVTECEIPFTVTHIVDWVHTAKDTSESPGLTPHIIGQIESELYDRVSKVNAPLSKIALDLDRDFGLKPSTCLWVVRHLIANRVWQVDMSQFLIPSEPLPSLPRKTKDVTVGEW